MIGVQNIGESTIEQALLMSDENLKKRASLIECN